MQFCAYSFNLSCQKANFSQVGMLMNNNNIGWVFQVDNRRYRPRQAKYFTRLWLVQYFSRLGRYLHCYQPQTIQYYISNILWEQTINIMSKCHEGVNKLKINWIKFRSEVLSLSLTTLGYVNPFCSTKKYVWLKIYTEQLTNNFEEKCVKLWFIHWPQEVRQL